MKFEQIKKIEESLSELDCKSYSLEIKFDDGNRVLLEKTPKDKEKQIGF